MASPGALDRSPPAAERSVAATVTVPAAVEAVWELACDPDRFAEWADRTLAVTRADRPLTIGSTYEERNAVAGPLVGRSRWTVVEHEPPRRTTHRAEGLPLTASFDFVLELRAAGDATELTLQWRYRPALGPLGALLDRLYFHRSLQASVRRSVENLRAIVEREAAAGAGGTSPA